MLNGSKFDIEQNTIAELRVECDNFLRLLWFAANMKIAVQCFPVLFDNVTTLLSQTLRRNLHKYLIFVYEAKNR